MTQRQKLLNDVFQKLDELQHHKETFRNFVSPEQVSDGYTIEQIEEDERFYRDLLRKMSMH